MNAFRAVLADVVKGVLFLARAPMQSTSVMSVACPIELKS